MSFLEQVERPSNLQEPQFLFVVKELFNKLNAVSKFNLHQYSSITEHKHAIIQTFIKSFKTHIGNDIYPCSRLIFPDKAGRLYFIKETTLARLIIKMYRIPKSSEDYDVLHNWKLNYNKTKFFTADTKNLRDLPLRAARIIANRRIVSSDNTDVEELSVSEINGVLDNLVDSTTSDAQISLLKPLFDKLSIDEIRWVLHIVLKKTILGVFEPYFFNWWHPDGYKLFQVCNNLQKTFNYLLDPTKRLNEQQLFIQPMLPFRPQLAHKLMKNYEITVSQFQDLSPMDSNFQKLFDLKGLNGKFAIEEKMDGDRMVLHKRGKNFKFYSRRLKDYTFLYGENFELGSLTKHLANAFTKSVDSVVLDGEMVAWDYKRKVVLPFGTLKSSAIQESVRQFTTIDQYEQQSSYPFFLIFDILHLNGVNLTNHPLFFRRNVLEKIINPISNRFEILPVIYGTSPEDIQQAIKNVVSARSEGILLKHIQLKYFVGHRNHQWIKVKPEYLEKFGENLDLCVIGKLPAIKNSYVCGLQDENGVFQSFCTVANGFTVDDYDKVERITHGKWVEYDPKNPPPDSILKFGTKKPKYWINPKDSVVLEIKARAIDSQVEKTYAVGTTLHNLYCRGIREDKSLDDATTLSEYRSMKARYSQDVDNSQTTNVKKRKLKQDSFIVPKTKIKIKSELFKSFNFVIASEYNEQGNRISIGELSALVKRHSGNVTLHPEKANFLQTIIITEKDVPSCKVYFDQGFDLVRPIYIFECISRNSIVPLDPRFLFKCHNVNDFKSTVDEFGDSYIVHNRFEELEQDKFIILDDMALDNYRNEFIATETSNISPPLRYLFNGIKFYVVGLQTKSENGLEGAIEARIARFGGFLTNNFHEAMYIIVPRDDKLRKRQLSECNKISNTLSQNLHFHENGTISPLPCIVESRFIDKCIEQNCVVDGDDFKFA
jgi:DNA ligase-4